MTSSPTSPSLTLIAASELIKQGAEAKIYKGYLYPDGVLVDGTVASPKTPILLKYRFPKKYRHPTLNATLTKARVSAEAKALVKCLRSGVNVPGIQMVDILEGVLGIEWIDGHTVRSLLGRSVDDGEEDEVVDPALLANKYGVTEDEVMSMIGTEIAKMHLTDIIHGDLTSSNMMLRKIDAKPTDLVLIDFGLSFVSGLVEDKAVDLYVLERAFSSTHPDSESLFTLVLKAYEKESGTKWKAVSRRLDEVRMRGRKRSMVG